MTVDGRHTGHRCRGQVSRDVVMPWSDSEVMCAQAVDGAPRARACARLVRPPPHGQGAHMCLPTLQQNLTRRGPPLPAGLCRAGGMSSQCWQSAVTAPRCVRVPPTLLRRNMNDARACAMSWEVLTYVVERSMGRGPELREQIAIADVDLASAEVGAGLTPGSSARDMSAPAACCGAPMRRPPYA